MTGIIETIKRLSRIPGVSGDEKLVRDEIIALIKGHCEYETDPLGNLIAYKKGLNRPVNKLMLSAHMDEVGLIVTHICDDGLLRFSTVGGIDARVLSGRAVEIGDNRVRGVIGAKAWHHLGEKERDEPPKPDKLFIDIGASDKQEAMEHVRQGDRAVFASEFTELSGSRILGRAFDDRAGCAIMTELIRTELEYDCVFAFTVQEETGCTGAKAAAYRVNPDISIAIEATTASDISGTPDDMRVCELGKGPVISFMDRGAVYDTGLYRLALKTAEEHGIACQPKAGVFGGNDSKSIQVARGGVRVMAVSLPCRYIHTPGNVLHSSDVSGAFGLLKRLIPATAGASL